VPGQVVCGEGMGLVRRRTVHVVMERQTTSAGAQLSRVGNRKYPRRRVSIVLQYAIFPAAILLLWQVCSEIGFVRRNVFPPPSAGVSRLVGLGGGAGEVVGREFRGIVVAPCG